MPSKKLSPELAIKLASRIPGTVFDAVLEWGQAINEAEVCTGEVKKTAEMRARLCGGDLMRLAAGLAKHLRPNRRSHVG